MRVAVLVLLGLVVAVTGRQQPLTQPLDTFTNLIAVKVVTVCAPGQICNEASSVEPTYLSAEAMVAASPQFVATQPVQPFATQPQVVPATMPATVYPSAGFTQSAQPASAPLQQVQSPQFVDASAFQTTQYPQPVASSSYPPQYPSQSAELVPLGSLNPQAVPVGQSPQIVAPGSLSQGFQLAGVPTPAAVYPLPAAPIATAADPAILPTAVPAGVLPPGALVPPPAPIPVTIPTGVEPEYVTPGNLPVGGVPQAAISEQTSVVGDVGYAASVAKGGSEYSKKIWQDQDQLGLLVNNVQAYAISMAQRINDLSETIALAENGGVALTDLEAQLEQDPRWKQLQKDDVPILNKINELVLKAKPAVELPAPVTSNSTANVTGFIPAPLAVISSGANVITDIPAPADTTVTPLDATTTTPAADTTAPAADTTAPADTTTTPVLSQKRAKNVDGPFEKLASKTKTASKWKHSNTNHKDDNKGHEEHSSSKKPSSRI